jgi:hypothetical protein
MARTLVQKLTCPTCGEEVPELNFKLEEKLQELIIKAIQERKPEWTQKSGICTPCLNYFQNMVTKQSTFKKLKGKLEDTIAKQHHKDKDS